MTKTKARKKLTRKQKSRLNKAAFRATHKAKTHKARARKSVKRTVRKTKAHKRTVRKSRAKKSSKRTSRARYRKGSMGERIRVNPRRRSSVSRRRNPGSTLHLFDGGIVSTERMGRSLYVTITSPHGEVHEYEATGAAAKKLVRAKTTSAARRALGGSTLRHINPGRSISRGHRLTGGRRHLKRTAKGRFARR